MSHLSPSGLDHELSGQMGGRLRLKRPDHDTLVQGVTRNNLKKNIKDSKTESKWQQWKYEKQSDNM